jgi:hypothetical protein
VAGATGKPLLHLDHGHRFMFLLCDIEESWQSVHLANVFDMAFVAENNIPLFTSKVILPPPTLANAKMLETK